MSAGNRLYDAAELQRLFAPRRIAIVGMSGREGSFGRRTFENLAHFRGEIDFVNPNYEELLGRPCHPSVSDLPEVPDLAVLVTPRERVEGVIDECIARGVGGALVYASGFGEMGGENAALQARVARKAHEAGLPLIGPNAIGYVNFSNGGGVTFLSDLDLPDGFDRAPRDRRIGLVSQSGALGLSLGQAMKRGAFFSHILACGNSSDVDAADCISYLAEDAESRAIVCLLEGVPDPRRMEAAIARAAARGKPTILCKMARGAEGAATAASHTGSLAGSHDAYRTMCERAGGVFVENYDEVLEVAQFFAKAPAPQADGAAIIATSGGAAVLCADAAEDAGVPLPQPTDDVRARLEARIPEFGAARNPCDVTAQVLNDREALVDCVRAMLGQEDYGALVVPHPMAYPFSVPRIGLFDDIAGEVGKPIVLVWMTGWLEGPGAWEAETAPNLPMFRSTRVCFETLAAWRRWHARRVEAERPRLTAPDPELPARIAAHAGAVTEREAKAMLAAYGVPVIEERRAATAEQAAEAAAGLGAPLVMKIDSPDLPHKTEAGGIALDLEGPEACAAEFEAMTARVRAHAPRARIEGVLIQRMAPKGLEIVVGARHDAAFGPLVVVGLGGVLVELMKDTVVAPAPVTPREAGDMLARLRGAAALAGFRDLPPVDLERLAETVARVSEFAADAGAALAELDVNPLICRGADLVAVDALIIPKEGGA